MTRRTLAVLIEEARAGLLPVCGKIPNYTEFAKIVGLTYPFLMAARRGSLLPSTASMRKLARSLGASFVEVERAYSHTMIERGEARLRELGGGA